MKVHFGNLLMAMALSFCFSFYPAAARGPYGKYALGQYGYPARGYAYQPYASSSNAYNVDNYDPSALYSAPAQSYRPYARYLKSPRHDGYRTNRLPRHPVAYPQPYRGLGYDSIPLADYPYPPRSYFPRRHQRGRYAGLIGYDRYGLGGGR